MGKRGPKKKPSKIIKLRGSNRAYRRPENEPEPMAKIPEPPKWLKGEALVEWERVTGRLRALGILSELDRAALVAYCQTWADYCNVLPYCRGKPIETKSGEKIATGILMKTANGNVIQNPAIGVRNRTLALLLRAAAEFGMTPAGRSNVNAEKPSKREDAAEQFLSGKKKTS